MSLTLQLLQVVIQPIEALVPELAVPLHPIGDLVQRSRLQPARPPLCLSSLRDQPGSLQHLEVLGDGGQAQGEGLGQLVDRGLALGEPRQDRSPRGIGERRKCRAGIDSMSSALRRALKRLDLDEAVQDTCLRVSRAGTGRGKIVET
jgi:hypothetical protein